MNTENETQEPKASEAAASLIVMLTAFTFICLLLAGCNTMQTLSAQSRNPDLPGTGLPTATARKLYGVCGLPECTRLPGCPFCLATQKYNRELAGKPGTAGQRRLGIRYYPSY